MSMLLRSQPLSPSRARITLRPRDAGIEICAHNFPEEKEQNDLRNILFYDDAAKCIFKIAVEDKESVHFFSLLYISHLHIQSEAAFGNKVIFLVSCLPFFMETELLELITLRLALSFMHFSLLPVLNYYTLFSRKYF